MNRPLALQAPQTPLADTIRQAVDTLRVVRGAVWPLADLLIRLWLAQAFFVSGVLKAGNWETALILARDEYPVPWLDPVTAAYTGVSIELIAPVLLALGFATRLAALPLLLLALVAQHHYIALDIHLFWAWLLGWYVIHGAGPLAVDQALRRGLSDSAIPFANQLLGAARWTTERLGPSFRLALRLWLAAGLVLAGDGLAVPAGPWLAERTLAVFDPTLALISAVLLALGLGVRLAALALLLTALATGMSGVPVEHLSWLALLLLALVLGGGGPLALDHFVPRLLERAVPGVAEPSPAQLAALPRVLIVGAGFGGISCAQGLRHAPVSVTLIDRHNYHLFQPLLYQVATTGLAASDIATPVREVFRDQRNARVLLGTVTGVDKERRAVIMDGRSLPYDYLVLATGASHSYFGRDDWEPCAPGLKGIDDATEIRRRVLLAFERAEATEDDAERAALMTFLIVGGGPTGVELAGAIAELARFGMERDFRRIDPRAARVILVQSGPRILPTFPEPLSAHATRALQDLGVEVVIESRVTNIDAQGVAVDGSTIAARTVLWAAGVVASPAARWLAAGADRAGRIQVEPDLSVPEQAEVFAIGDTALAEAWDGKPVPGLAPAAKQGGAYVARVIAARVTGRSPPGPFRYRHQGSLATIGRKAAVVDLGWLRVSGALAWWLWGLIHVFFLVGVRNRVAVIANWFWAYLTFRSGTRLIVGQLESAQPSSDQLAPAPGRPHGA